MNRLLLFALLSVSKSFSQTISIPDAVFKSTLIEKGVDTSGDGEIQESEALAVTILNIWTITTNPNKINSLEGIQYFTNLVRLDCSGHNIATLDVTPLTNLEILYCGANQMTSLNVTGLSNLERLWCYSNELQTLDLTGLTNLDWLYCSENQLTSLALENTPNLGALWAEYNQLTELNFLPLNDVMEVYCRSNQISHLDVNHLAQLYYLDCSYNQIATINVDNMPMLQDFLINGNLVEELDCTLSPVLRLNCNDNPNLKYIYIKNNVISGADPDLLYYGFDFQNLPALEFICMDEGEQYALSVSGYNDLNQNPVVSTSTCSLGSDEFSQQVVVMYPNPVTNSVVIESNNEMEGYEIFDISGRQIVQGDSKQSAEFAIPNLVPGMYLLRLEFADRRPEIIKFIKQ